MSLTTKSRVLLLIGTVAAFFVVGTLVVSAASPPDLTVHFFFEDGKMAPLKSGVTYQASKLPLPVRVTPAIAGWRGTQWKANGFSPVEIEKRHLTCSSSPKVCAPPYFGWAVIGQAGTAATKGVPRGIVLVMAGYSRTPSVAATVHNLRTRGSGATYEQTSAVTVGGLAGLEFDGQTTGALHRFIPFSPPTAGAGSFPDEIDLHGAERDFRFIVLGARGKTVIVFVGTEALPPDQFAGFLANASGVVASLRFPR